MLTTLRIRHLAVIEDLTIVFGSGLNVLTGETGAGKSIVVDAVGLAAGDRAEGDLIRTGEDRAVVEAVFALPAGSPVFDVLKERGLEAAEGSEIAVRREVRTSGAGGRVFVNGSPTTVSLLREIGDDLVDLHGQHEHQTLLSTERQRELLDAYGGLTEATAAVVEAFGAVREARERLAELEAVVARRRDRVEDLERVVREIDAVRPRPGEAAELDRERRLLQEGERVARWLEEGLSFLYEGEPSASALASAAGRRVRELGELDPSLAGWAERVEAAQLELQEAGVALRDYRARTRFDPSRLEAIESRRAALAQLLRRHGPDEEAALEARAAAATELATLEGAETALADAVSRVAGAEETYVRAAAALTRGRQDAARRMAAEVLRQLRSLALEKARFEVSLSPAPGPTLEGGGIPLSSGGAERAEFLLAANPGEEPRPLARAVSGGELSRVMLALHLLVDGGGKGRVLVFDEVDAGIGGAVADAVGQRLARLADRAQVLLVTHLPQVAAYADHHYHVVKTVSGGRTRVQVAEIRGEERVEALSRMVGGRAATASSRRHAAELLAAARVAVGAARSRA